MSARCTATKTERVAGIPTVRRCTREDTPQAHEDGYHQWMRSGHAVRWPVRVPGPADEAHLRDTLPVRGADNATGLRGAIARLSQLDAQGRPL